VLLVEHNMQVVMGVCESIHVMDRGETIAHGNADEVKNHPKVLEAYLGKGSQERTTVESGDESAKADAKSEVLLKVDNLYEDPSGQLVNHLMQSLKAQSLFARDVDYLIQDGEIKIIDELTGRVLEGRRYSEGLHQAIEAKEGVKIKEENQTLATITLQNYFRLYEKLAGMTGTAATEADEFRQIYAMEVIVVPPNRPMIRDDEEDLIYKNEAAKFRAVVEEKLAACVNILGPCRSIYRWEGAIETATETPALFKTTMKKSGALIMRVKELHIYSVPAIVVWPIERLLADYGDWVESELR
jgi:uncharacterized protein involved in tolerance to divalent cations